MEIVNFLAQFWGFSLLIISLSFLINPNHVNKIFQFMENEASVVMSGITGVVLGIILILHYNVWDHSWRVIITILAWAFLTKGIIRLFFPNVVLKVLSKIKNKIEWAPFFFFCIVLLGCFLIYKGFLA